MAMKKLYALHDKAIGAFLNPLVFTTDAEAVRWFEMVVNQTDDRNNAIAAHYSDYALYSLGEMDDKSGEIKARVHKVMDGFGVKSEELVSWTIDELFKELERFKGEVAAKGVQ